MEGRADNPIMLRRAPAEREQDLNNTQEVRNYLNDFSGEIPFCLG